MYLYIQYVYIYIYIYNTYVYVHMSIVADKLQHNFWRLHQRRMTWEAQVVVGAKVEHRLGPGSCQLATFKIQETDTHNT